MNALFVILLVIFTMDLFLWLLSLLGAIPNAPNYSPWLAFFACLILGIVVFLLGTGIIVAKTVAIASLFC